MTLSVEDSHANPSPSLANDGHKTIPDGFGPSSHDAFAYYDPDSHCWKTSQVSFLPECQTYSETWPRAGMTRNGTAYRRPPLVPRTSASGFGYLPTPDASLGAFECAASMDATSWYNKELTGQRKSGAMIGSSVRWCPEFVREWLRTGGELNPEWIEVLMGFPTGWTDLEDSETP